MKILFDQGTPSPLRTYFTSHTVDTTYELGWAGKKNGELLALAEMNGYQLLMTTGQSLQHQQKLSERRFAVLVLLTTSWRRLRNQAEEIAQMRENLRPGAYAEYDPE